MNQTEFRIKAKKISELDNFMPGHTIPYDGDDTYLALAYTQNDARQNYKVSLKELAVAISNDYGINDDNLRDRILDMIENGDIQLPAGPQGPQGPSGEGGMGCMCECDCDGIKDELADIQRKLDEILRILVGTSKEYSVSYDLSNINAVSTNPSKVKYNESATFKFTNPNGYVFPDTVEVNTPYTYSKSGKSITIDPITNFDFDTITMKIVGVLGYYSLTVTTTNLTYSIIENNKPSYTIQDNPIKIKFTVPEGYNMPTQSQITVTNASIVTYNSTAGELTIRCTGAGDMRITAAGQKIQILTTYYFRFVAYKHDDAGILEYDAKGNPNGVIHINNTFYSSSGKCPITYSNKYRILEDKEYDYGTEDVYIILPKKYFNTSTYKFLDDSNKSYNIITGTLPIPVNINSNSVYQGTVDGEPYVIIRIAPEGLHYQFVSFQQI